jgi:hypothetical protein
MGQHKQELHIDYFYQPSLFLKVVTTSNQHPAGLGMTPNEIELNGFGIKNIQKIGWGFPL